MFPPYIWYTLYIVCIILFIRLGDFGLNTYIKYFDNRYSNILIIKTNRDAQNKVHFALSCISNIIDITCLIRSLSIQSCSRTCINKLKEIFHLHFHQLEAISETEKLSAIEIINTNIINLEL